MDKKLEELDLSTCYLNLRRVTELIGSSAVSAVTARARGRSTSELVGLAEAAIVTAGYKDALIDWLASNGRLVVPLERRLLTGDLQQGAFFTAHTDFYGNVNNKKRQPLRLKKNLDLERNSKTEIVISLHEMHICPGSPRDRLSGRKRLFVFGIIDKISKSAIQASAYYAGTVIPKGDQFDGDRRWVEQREVRLDEIDSFSKILDMDLPRENELELLRDIPEKKIKAAFCGILGEQEVPKDWGGEASDLFTTRVKLNGQYVSTAFCFKGPAKFHKMTVKDLGKNGDQIDRLFGEPAELLVLQHCHYVPAPVRNMMKAYANQVGDPRLFCVIDGLATIRLLRAYRRCGL